MCVRSMFNTQDIYLPSFVIDRVDDEIGPTSCRPELGGFTQKVECADNRMVQFDGFVLVLEVETEGPLRFARASSIESP